MYYPGNQFHILNANTLSSHCSRQNAQFINFLFVKWFLEIHLDPITRSRRKFSGFAYSEYLSRACGSIK